MWAYIKATNCNIIVSIATTRSYFRIQCNCFQNSTIWQSNLFNSLCSNRSCFNRNIHIILLT